MSKRSTLSYVAVSAAIFVAGLVLGAGRSDADTSAANTASKLMLTVGLLALVITGVLAIVARRRQQGSNS